MPEKTIIAHYMHEQEEAAAANVMDSFERTDGYLIGQIDEADIPGLREQGLIVEILDDRSTLPSGDADDEAYMVGDFGVQPGASPKGIGDEFLEDNYYVVELQGPLLATRKQALDAIGVTLLERIAPNRYTVKLAFGQLVEVSDLPFVLGVSPFSEASGQQEAAPKAFGPETGSSVGGVEMLPFDVRLHQATDMGEALDWLEANNIPVATAVRRKIRLYLMNGSPLREQIGRLPWVEWIQPYVPPKFYNTIARQLLGLDDAEAADGSNSVGVSRIPYEGEGEIIGVADTGLDETHPDFQGRIEGVVALGRLNDPSDPVGHGTHVAGSAVGDGSASKGEIRGSAPAAGLYFQSIMDALGRLGGLPADLYELFDEAYMAGVRIHNNSWGADTRSFYTSQSDEVDVFVADKRDMLVVIAAGNEGQGRNLRNAQPGFVDWLSISSPGSSKNALTVGASRSSRVSGGWAQKTWGELWPVRYPTAPIKQETTSGDPEALAAFSSRGPCTDRRIKPDLVAPGTNILSAKSSIAPLRKFWGGYAANGKYAFMGGTSMATPLVSGCAALVREYYRKERDHTPSAALLKATLINGTKRLSSQDAIADHTDLPNYHQGFGFLYMPWVIPNVDEPFKLEFMDTIQTPNLQLADTGSSIRLAFKVSGGERLRICLAWTDLPASGLQNNLDLFVQNVQSGQKMLGNQNLPNSLNIPDPENNVEIVRVDNPPPGDYLIKITATNLLQGPQDYALVVTGDLASGLVRV